MENRPVSRLSNSPSNSLARALQSLESDSSLEMYELQLALERKPQLYSLQSSLDIPGGDSKNTSQLTKSVNAHDSPDYSIQTIVDMSSIDNKENKPRPALNIPRPSYVIRNSTVYTNLSSDSSRQIGSNASYENNRKVIMQRDESPEIRKKPQNQELDNSIFKSSLGIFGRGFCPKCCVYVNTTARPDEKGVWKTILNLFQAVRCCGDPKAPGRYQVHVCTDCGSEVTHN